MNKSKKAIVVILSILIVLTSFAAYVSSALRLGVLNPSVYAKFMPMLNAYDSMYDSFTSYLLEPIRAMDVPQEVQGVPEDIVEIGISKKDFNKRVGKAIGGGIGWLLYNHEDVEIPVKYFAENLKSAIAQDERITNSETNIQATMEAIVIRKLEIFVPSDDYEQTFRGYVYYYLTSGNQDFMNTYDYWVDVFFYYYGVRLSIITALSFVLLLLLMIILILITKEKRQTPIRLAKGLCIFYGSLNVLVALVLFTSPWIVNLFSSLDAYAKYLGYAKSIINSFSALALVYGLLLFAVVIIWRIIEGNITQKRAKTIKEN